MFITFFPSSFLFFTFLSYLCPKRSEDRLHFSITRQTCFRVGLALSTPSI